MGAAPGARTMATALGCCTIDINIYVKVNMEHEYLNNLQLVNSCYDVDLQYNYLIILFQSNSYSKT